jgi:hypothetical protein
VSFHLSQFIRRSSHIVDSKLHTGFAQNQTVSYISRNSITRSHMTRLHSSPLCFKRNTPVTTNKSIIIWLYLAKKTADLKVVLSSNEQYFPTLKCRQFDVKSLSDEVTCRCSDVRTINKILNTMAQQPYWTKASSLSRIHDHTQFDTPHSVGLLWTSDQSDLETSTWQHTTLTRDRHPCPPAHFEPTIPASERPQTHALERAATGIGN